MLLTRLYEAHCFDFLRARSITLKSRIEGASAIVQGRAQLTKSILLTETLHPQPSQYQNLPFLYSTHRRHQEVAGTGGPVARIVPKRRKCKLERKKRMTMLTL